MSSNVEVEMQSSASSRPRRPSRRVKNASRTKIWCRGLETAPVVATIVIGFLLILLGIAAILTGPSCVCDLAVPWWAEQLAGSPPTNTSLPQDQWVCTECPWVFASCTHQEVEVPCQRGCVLTVGTDPRETFCLAQALLVVFKEVEWVNFSVLQKAGLGVGLLGVALIILALGLAYYKGKKILS